jgi:hypothetical protein
VGCCDSWRRDENGGVESWTSGGAEVGDNDGKVRFDPRFNGSRPCLPLYHLGSVRFDPLADFRSGACSEKVRTAPLAG